MKNIELVYRTEDMEKGKIRIINHLNSITNALKTYEKVKNVKQNLEYAYLRKFKKVKYVTIKILFNKEKENDR